jgi:CxxC motif-containing protein (DUF1111 family)
MPNFVAMRCSSWQSTIGFLLGVWIVGMLLLQACRPDSDLPTYPAAADEEHLLGGATTVEDVSPNAFGNPAANLTAERSRDFFTGNSFFRQNWVTAPSSTTGRDGLGPVFNQLSCGGCHFNDGRGRPPLPSETSFISMLLRLSIPGQDAHGGPLGEPTYGGQLQDKSILGVLAEGTPNVTWVEVPGTFPDGEPYSLRQPSFGITGWNFGNPQANLLVSPRVAPHMIGLGLLEALEESTLLALADEADANGDGISGRPNYVWDVEHQRTTLGRFGWKANQPHLRQQVAGAFLGDLGLTTSIFPHQNCGPNQTDCQNAPAGGTPEVEALVLERVVFYSATLAVPQQRNASNAQVKQGKQLFLEIGCGSCHVAKLKTGTLAGFPELSNQNIRPYTDLLLHDMGPGLADNRPDFLATGTEWRTPPLWGIGLFQAVNHHTFYLHDGRARNLQEAILWHGGEAQTSRDRYSNLAAEQRQAILAFLNSL